MKLISLTRIDNVTIILNPDQLESMKPEDESTIIRTKSGDVFVVIEFAQDIMTTIGCSLLVVGVDEGDKP